MHEAASGGRGKQDQADTLSSAIRRCLHLIIAKEWTIGVRGCGLRGDLADCLGSQLLEKY